MSIRSKRIRATAAEIDALAAENAELRKRIERLEQAQTTFLSGTELDSAPAAPPANGWRIYAIDTGGKTDLYVRFSSGAAQQIAIQP